MKYHIFLFFLFALAFFMTACAGVGAPPASSGEDAPVTEPSVTEASKQTHVFAGSATVIPDLDIEVEGRAEITSKEDYLRATVIFDGDGAHSMSAQVRGRGNSSWTEFEKKSYRLKFDERQSLHGMAPAKDYLLISSALDRSLMQNYTALKLAAALGADYVPACEFVHLYLNGSYHGLYLLTERIEEDKNRLDLGDGTSGKADVGYLIEFGGNIERNTVRFAMKSFSYNGTTYTWRKNFYARIKSPDEAVCTGEQYAYIENYVNRVNEAIFMGDYTAFSRLCDVDSFVISFLVNEILLNNDMDFSYYMYKKPNGKLYLGPVWDFDQACGISTKVGSRYQGWTVSDFIDWHAALIEMPEFCAKVMEYWESYRELIFSLPEDIEAKANAMRPDIDRNYARWQVLGEPYWRMTPEMADFTTYDEYLDRLTWWLTNRLAWMDREMSFWVLPTAEASP